MDQSLFPTNAPRTNSSPRIGAAKSKETRYMEHLLVG